MTKQTKTLAALAAALVVCGGAYAALRVWNDQQAQVDDTVYVTQLSDFTGLTLTNSAGTLLHQGRRCLAVRRGRRLPRRPGGGGGPGGTGRHPGRHPGH